MHTFSQVAGGPTITKLSFVMLEYCANLVEEAEVQAWLSVEITIGAYCNGALLFRNVRRLEIRLI